MAQQTERGVLNHLIEICRDGEKGLRIDYKRPGYRLSVQKRPKMRCAADRQAKKFSRSELILSGHSR